MALSRSWWSWGAAGLVTAAILPFAAQGIRGPRQNGCALDGMETSPRVRVRLLDSAGQAFQFCSLTCAELWLQSSGVRPEAIYVSDESTGSEIEASQAYYVRSRVVAHAPTRERRHVFRRQSDAEAHAKAFRGRTLTGVQRPFSEWFGE